MLAIYTDYRGPHFIVKVISLPAIVVPSLFVIRNKKTDFPGVQVTYSLFVSRHREEAVRSHAALQAAAAIMRNIKRGERKSAWAKNSWAKKLQQ